MKKFDLHSDYLDSSLSLQAREQKLKNFHNGQTWILVSTDVLARGLDFPHLKTVINFDFPNSLVEYIHRVGRTGRAGKEGRAVTFFTEGDQVMLREVAGMLDESGVEVPDWILKLRKGAKRQIKSIQKNGVEREDMVYDRNSKASRKRFKEFEGFVKRQDYKFKSSQEVLKKREAGDLVEETSVQPDFVDDGEFKPMTKEQMEMFGIVVGGPADDEDQEKEVPSQKEEKKGDQSKTVELKIEGQASPKSEKKKKTRKARITLKQDENGKPKSILKRKKLKKVKRNN